LDHAVVYLIPVGHDRYELYTEAADDDGQPGDAPRPTDPWWRRTLHRMQAQWREAVDAARGKEASGWFARARDRVVRRAAESIAEQRTLWALRHFTSATLVHADDLPEDAATATRDRLLGHARRHHGKWLAIDGVLFAGSGVLMLVPGPNVLAYYFAFRLIGHYLSWRGARQALEATTWHLRPEPALAELGRVALMPRSARAARVQAVAARLNLPRLAAFFDRTAIE
jgi:hypothetical protein